MNRICAAGSSPHTRGTRPWTASSGRKYRFIPAYAGNAYGKLAAGRRLPVHPRIRGERWIGIDAERGLSGSSPHTRGTHVGGGFGVGVARFIPAYAGNAVSTSNIIPLRCGSSPHTRGTLSIICLDLDRGRFIPAYAGNAGSRPGARWWRSVHPRIRGERMIAQAAEIDRIGSSPHTRGTRYHFGTSNVVYRFIPAYAGNAQRTMWLKAARSVHPRIRGERDAAAVAHQIEGGSSPHTRGTRIGYASQILNRRFIPAYAGNAADKDEVKALQTVHPRIRGERQKAIVNRHSGHGSSPHTRGTPKGRGSIRQRTRFIPAYAGNALTGPWSRSCLPVHPRIRGERALTSFSWALMPGSSPHTRGTHDRQREGSDQRRFIPAYAGNAGDDAPQRRRSPVHPRIRGERMGGQPLADGGGGSSPHTRGTRVSNSPWAYMEWFIPAYAGNAPIAAQGKS